MLHIQNIFLNMWILFILATASAQYNIENELLCKDVFNSYCEANCPSNPSSTLLFSFPYDECIPQIVCQEETLIDILEIDSIYNGSMTLKNIREPSTANFLQIPMDFSTQNLYYGLQSEWINLRNQDGCNVGILSFFSDSPSILADPGSQQDRDFVLNLGNIAQYKFVTETKQQGFENIINATTVISLDLQTSDDGVGASYFFNFTLFPRLQAVTIKPSRTGVLSDLTTASLFSLADLNELRYVEIQGTSITNLTGFIDVLVSNNPLLEHLDISTCVPQDPTLVPESVGLMPVIRYLRLFDNNHFGTLDWSSSFTTLQFFDISQNNFNGALPMGLTENNNLTLGFDVSDNLNLAGVISSGLGNRTDFIDYRNTNIFLALQDTSTVCDSVNFTPGRLFVCEQTTAGATICGSVACCDATVSLASLGYQSSYGPSLSNLQEIFFISSTAFQTANQLTTDFVNAAQNNSPLETLLAAYLDRLNIRCYLNKFEYDAGGLTNGTITSNQKTSIDWVQATNITDGSMLSILLAPDTFTSYVIDISGEANVIASGVPNVYGIILDGGVFGGHSNIVDNLEVYANSDLHYLEIYYQRNINALFSAMSTSATQVRTIIVENVEENACSVLSSLNWSLNRAYLRKVRYLRIENLRCDTPTPIVLERYDVTVGDDAYENADEIELLFLENLSIVLDTNTNWVPPEILRLSPYNEADSFNLFVPVSTFFTDTLATRAYDFRGYVLDYTIGPVLTDSSPVCDPMPETSYLPFYKCTLDFPGPPVACQNLFCYDYDTEETRILLLLIDLALLNPNVDVNLAGSADYVVGTQLLASPPTPMPFYGEALQYHTRGDINQFDGSSHYKPVLVVDEGAEAYPPSFDADAIRNGVLIRSVALEFIDVCNTTLVRQLIELFDPMFLSFTYSALNCTDVTNDPLELGITKEKVFGISILGNGTKPFTENFVNTFAVEFQPAIFQLENFPSLSNISFYTLIDRLTSTLDRLTRLSLVNVPGAPADLFEGVSQLGVSESIITLKNVGLHGKLPPLSGVYLDVRENALTAMSDPIQPSDTLEVLLLSDNPNLAGEPPELTRQGDTSPLTEVDISNTLISNSEFGNDFDICGITFTTNEYFMLYTNVPDPLNQVCPLFLDSNVYNEKLENMLTQFNFQSDVYQYTHVSASQAGSNSPLSSLDLNGDGNLDLMWVESAVPGNKYVRMYAQSIATLTLGADARSGEYTAGDLTTETWNDIVEWTPNLASPVVEVYSTTNTNPAAVSIVYSSECTLTPTGAVNAIHDLVIRDVNRDTLDDVCFLWTNSSSANYLRCYYNDGTGVCGVSFDDTMLPVATQSLEIIEKSGNNTDVCLYTYSGQLISVAYMDGTPQLPATNKTMPHCEGGGSSFTSDMEYRDFDGDGFKDLILLCLNTVPSVFHSVFIYFGNADYNYGESIYQKDIRSDILYSDLISRQPLQVEDVNGDGARDVFFQGSTPNARFATMYNLKNRALGTERSVSPASIKDVHLYDYNQDGDLDIVTLGNNIIVVGQSYERA